MKNGYTHANPSFFCIKVGFMGLYISRTGFPDDCADQTISYPITKTCSCINEYSPIPHYYIAKLGYAGVYLFLAHLSR